jgi:hypothetical protein
MPVLETIALESQNESEIKRWYVLFLLTLVYALNIADRFVISTLIEPIKADLNGPGRQRRSRSQGHCAVGQDST